MKMAMKRARHRAGMTLQQLSARSGVSAGTIGNWERGIGSLTMENMSAVCTVLGISLEEYIGQPCPGYKFIPEEEDLRELRDALTRITRLLLRWEKEIEEAKK